ncbi:hypothetical protein CLOSTMETH_00462 [[Clostridium] methylpentosum DSM 5476]|uniref:Uncharacterized protein n=1 Tax=[Clostridium] methylpentosum DSM 5476 TaxID=537013 RepID=C0E9G3_9FIRM|nr:hypothetical protein CLOSTMETH_00462 [[Clostridium] methylpentosum DSM 5476]
MKVIINFIIRLPPRKVNGARRFYDADSPRPGWTGGCLHRF